MQVMWKLINFSTRPGTGHGVEMEQQVEMQTRPFYGAPLIIDLGIVAQFGRNSLCVLRALIPSDHFLNRKTFEGYSALTFFGYSMSGISHIVWGIAVSTVEPVLHLLRSSILPPHIRF